MKVSTLLGLRAAHVPSGETAIAVATLTREVLAGTPPHPHPPSSLHAYCLTIARDSARWFSVDELVVDGVAVPLEAAPPAEEGASPTYPIDLTLAADTMVELTATNHRDGAASLYAALVLEWEMPDDDEPDTLRAAAQEA